MATPAPKFAPVVGGRKNSHNCSACGFKLNLHSSFAPCVVALFRVTKVRAAR